MPEDFAGKDLSGFGDLIGADLTGANLRGFFLD
ncbi:MAG: hypothetical protein Ct9H300mP11_16300 [Chloroflexota bacterium]|nr:MAG: hypothetical protein Ct9H300mP11_16300 [Chloroflexota bacterium]